MFLSLSERVTQIQSKENRRIQITGHSTDNWLRLFEKVHVTKEKKKKRQERQFWNSAVQQKYNVTHTRNLKYFTSCIKTLKG